MYEAGYYNAVVSGQGFSTSKNKGTPSFDLQAMLKEKVDISGEKSPVTQARRTVRLWLTKDTMEPGKGTYEAFKVLGVYGDLEDYNPDNPEHRSLVGKEVRLRCRHTEYKGEMQEEWSLVTGTGKPKNDVEALKKLATLGLPPLPPPPPAEEPTPEPQSTVTVSAADTEDLPF